jgi:hypothetical protein
MQVTLVLRKDGTGNLNVSSNMYGAGDEITWTATKHQFTFTNSEGKITVCEIISVSKTDLILRMDADTLTNFKRMGDAPKRATEAASTKVPVAETVKAKVAEPPAPPKPKVTLKVKKLPLF